MTTPLEKLGSRYALFGLLLVLCGGVPSSQLQQSLLRQHTFAGSTEPSAPKWHVAPNDPDIAYTEYVEATIGPLRASFSRPTVMGVGDGHSPGTRVSFTTDATRVVMRVDYIETLGTPGAGIFRLEVDGLLEPRRFGSDTDTGENAYVLLEQAQPRRRELSLILPYASNVDFLGLELTGGTAGLSSPPPARPAFLYVAYGDSITHGFDASSIAEGYPYQVGCLQTWSVINMGFTGRKVTPSDGLSVGALQGDVVSLEIGTNDYLAETSALAFETRYEALLDNVRLLQPTVPIYAFTPTKVAWDGVPNGEGLTVEDYRQLIRDVVLARTVADTELYLVEGSTLLPLGQSFLADGIHPNDAGFALYATTLGGSNLVANPGVETDRFAWADFGDADVSSADPNTGLESLRVGPGGGMHEQPVGRVRRAEDYALSAWSKVGAAGEVGALGISFYDELGVELAKEEVAVSWTAYQQSTLLISTPASFAQAKVWCAKGAGPSELYADDFELLEVGQASVQTYGQGRAGWRGVPALVLSGTPVAPARLTLWLENTSGGPTVGFLRIARRAPPVASVPSFFRSPNAPTAPFVVPVGGADLPLFLTEAHATGERLFFQGLLIDPTAAGGLAESPVLALVLGSAR